MCLVCCILARQRSLLLVTSVSGSRKYGSLTVQTSVLSSSNEIGHVECSWPQSPNWDGHLRCFHR